MEGHRWTPQESLQIGVVDELADGGTEGVMQAARKLAESRAPLAKTGVFGLMKKDLMREIFNASLMDDRLVHPVDSARLARARL